MFRVKICGITNRADALSAASAGADAIGLNFYVKSPRSLTLSVAREIIATLPENIVKVGLFVNHSVEAIMQVTKTLSLDMLQLHGDESPAFVKELSGHKVLKAFRLRDAAGIDAALAYVAECARQGTPLAGVLADAYVVDNYGGTGKTVDSSLANSLRTKLGHIPLILAGGLTAENVGAAIEATNPWGVDTASGVETSPGQKDRSLMERFVAAARTALELPR